MLVMMGCASSVEREEIVRRCRERRRLIKQVVRYRNEFAASHLAYLQALKNTGATLKQFAEADTFEICPASSSHFRVTFPPPPPPPPLSPSNTHYTAPTEEVVVCDQNEITVQENAEIDDPGTPPPPSTHGSSWESWDPFAPTSPRRRKSEQFEDEDWAETNTEFEDEEGLEIELISKVIKSPAREMDNTVLKLGLGKSSAGETDYWVSKLLPDKSPSKEVDDNSSMVSWHTKDFDMAMVMWRTRKSLVGLVKDLDDYFLKASASGNEIAILMEANRSTSLLQNFVETKKNSFKSAKVFSSLSWSKSSKSLLASRDSFEFPIMDEVYRPISLSDTLDKINVEEQKLYEEVKGEQIAKRQHDKDVHLLQRQQANNQAGQKVDKTRVSIEKSRSQVNSLKLAVATTFSTIVKLRDEELQRQLVELSGGLMKMWRTMYECHQVQNHISQQLNNLNDQLSTEATTKHHRLATIQLEREVTALYHSFCNLIKSHRDYARLLHSWIKLTNCLTEEEDECDGFHFPDAIALCEQWHVAVERLPDKVTSEAIKSFVSVIHSISIQQATEHKLRKKVDRLEKILDRKTKSLTSMEKKSGENFAFNSNANAKHPLYVKRQKADAFRRKVDEHRSKYRSCVQVTRAMMLHNLQTGLPNVLQALTGFANVSMQAFEALYNQFNPSKGATDENKSGRL